jgi:hypothetical protein
VIKFYKNIYVVFACLLLAIGSCKSGADKKGKHINLSDSSSIVTEYDSAFLENKVADLAEVRGTKNINNVDKVMRQVDSAKKAETIPSSETVRDIKGFTIQQSTYAIILDGAITKSGNRYIFQTGAVPENMNIQIKGLTNAKIQQRTNSKLILTVADKAINLDRAGEFTTPWKELQSSNNNFVSLSKSDMPFKKIAAAQLFAVSEPYLNKSGIAKPEIKRIAAELKKTDSDNSAYYKCEAQFIELRITGTNGSNKVADIIRIAK